MLSSLVFLSCLICVLRFNDCTDIGHTVDSPHRRRPNGMRRSTTVSPTPPSPQCGNRSSDYSDTADESLSDHLSDLGQWPWMAALFFWDVKKGKVKKSTAVRRCGGSLISNQWVLTAAHCITPNENDQLAFVRLGDVDLRDWVNDGATPVDVPVKKIIYHSKYNNETFDSDIGLLHLAKKVKFTENIYPICLLSGSNYIADDYYDGKVGIIAGWGATKVKPSSDVLKHTSVTIGDCKKNFESERAGEVTLDYRILCAGDTENDSCQGDSGGPLMLESEETGAYYQAGIVSNGKDCAVEDYPGIYTKVPAFIPWINKKTGLKF